MEIGLVSLVVKKGQRLKKPVPLKSVDVVAKIVQTVAEVEVTQVYFNNKKKPIEIIYYFPLDFGGAVTHFHAELGERRIQGVVKRNEEAKEEYEDAVESQTTAFVCEQTESDIFKVQVGFLQPGIEVKIVIGYTTELKNEDWCKNLYRFYIPAYVGVHDFFSRDKPWWTQQQNIHNTLQKVTAPSPLTINVEITSRDEIEKVKSPTHRVSVGQPETVKGQSGGTWSKVVVSLKGDFITTMDLNRDFVLLVTLKENYQPRLYSERFCTSLAVLTNFVPSFKFNEQKVEIHFLLDNADSMCGQNVTILRKALDLLIGSLPADCHFNIMECRTYYHKWFPTSVQCTESNLRNAKAMIKALSPKTWPGSGTDLCTLLNNAYVCPNIQDYARQIIIITDGQLTNPVLATEVIKCRFQGDRIFCLGIGDSPSHRLVEGVAEAGGGTSAFVTYNELMEEKVLNLLANALTPSLSEVKIDWHGCSAISPQSMVDAPKEAEVCREKTLLGYGKPVQNVVEPAVLAKTKAYTQAPEKIPPIYDSGLVQVFGVFENFIKEEQPTGLTFTAQSPDGPLSLFIPLEAENDLGESEMLHKLSAIRIVRELENKVEALEVERPKHASLFELRRMKADLKKKIIDISLANGFASMYTAFVAVDSKPIEEPKRWSKLFQFGEVHTKFVQREAPQIQNDKSIRTATKGRGEIFKNMRSKSRPLMGRITNFFEHPHRRDFETERGGRVESKRPTCATRSNRFRWIPSIRPYLRSKNAKLQKIPQSESTDFEARLLKSTPIKSFITDKKEDNLVPVKCEVLAEDDKVSQDKMIIGLVNKILTFQNENDGSFPLSESFLMVISFDFKKIREEASKYGWDDTAWATALALVFIEKKIMEEKEEEGEELKVKVEKAKEYLEKSVGQEKGKEMIALARAVLSEI